MAEILAQYPNGFVSPLKSVGVLSLEGIDAVPFIHRQLSNDIEHLGVHQARLAAYCTPQGRVLALFTVWKDNGKVMLALPKDILSAIQKRLRMYVLRDKVTVSDVSDTYQVLGVCQETALGHLGFPVDAPTETYAKAENGTSTLIRWPDAFDNPRWLLFSRQQDAPALSDALLVNENVWLLTEIEAGMPRVNQAIQDKFLPQTLNLEPLGGLSFTKGCYPGQEIVSRVKYRGAIKSGLFKGILPVDGNDGFAIPDGTALYNASGNESGMVILSAIDGKMLHCLVVARFEDAEVGQLHLANSEGPAIKLFPCLL
ncbi:MAG: YgfZ/GcvT domain-containing protein [Oxalobacter sp.]